MSTLYFVLHILCQTIPANLCSKKWMLPHVHSHSLNKLVHFILCIYLFILVMNVNTVIISIPNLDKTVILLGHTYIYVSDFLYFLMHIFYCHDEINEYIINMCVNQILKMLMTPFQVLFNNN